jgi:catechol 2,3-dioxygenase-like lactoylglutathione lyase family enzyme
MRLNQVTVGSHDVARAAAFYQQLGLQLIVDALPRYVRLLCPDGDSTFSIHLFDEAVRSTTVVYFECNDLDAQVVRLKAAGIVFKQEPVDQSWLWREAHLHDPDGNPVCLYFAGNNRLDPPWRV